MGHVRCARWVNLEAPGPSSGDCRGERTCPGRQWGVCPQRQWHCRGRGRGMDRPSPSHRDRHDSHCRRQQAPWETQDLPLELLRSRPLQQIPDRYHPDPQSDEQLLRDEQKHKGGGLKKRVRLQVSRDRAWTCYGTGGRGSHPSRPRGSTPQSRKRQIIRRGRQMTSGRKGAPASSQGQHGQGQCQGQGAKQCNPQEKEDRCLHCGGVHTLTDCPNLSNDQLEQLLIQNWTLWR